MPERKGRFRVGAQVHDRSGTRFAHAKRRPSILRGNRRRMMRKLLLTTVAVAAIVGVAGVASAQTMQTPSGGNAAKPESTEHQAPGAMGGAMRATSTAPGAAKSAQVPAQGTKPDQKLGQDGEKQMTPQRGAQEEKPVLRSSAARRKKSPVRRSSTARRKRNPARKSSAAPRKKSPARKSSAAPRKKAPSLAPMPTNETPARPAVRTALPSSSRRRSARKIQTSSAIVCGARDQCEFNVKSASDTPHGPRRSRA